MGSITMFALVLYTYADLGTHTIRYYADHGECKLAQYRMNDQLDPYKGVAQCQVITISKEQ